MWPSETVASRVYDIANVGLIVGLVIGVLATVLVIWMGNVKEAYSQHKLSDTNAVAALANERAQNLEHDNLTLKSDLAELQIAASQASTAQAQVEIELAKQRERTATAERAIASAQEQASNANEAAEREHTARLQLEEDISPRLIEQGHSAEQLKSFKGMRFAIKVVDGADLETRRTAGQLRVLCQLAGWVEDGSLLVDSHITMPREDGIQIEANGPRLFPDVPRDDISSDASEALEAILQLNKIQTSIWRRGLRGTTPALPTHTVIFHVGLKPIGTYFLKEKTKEGITDKDGNTIYGNSGGPQ